MSRDICEHHAMHLLILTQDQSCRVRHVSGQLRIGMRWQALLSPCDNVEDPRPSGQDRPNHQGIWKDGPDDFDIPRGHSTE
jgi:hypothetical protein